MSSVFAVIWMLSIIGVIGGVVVFALSKNSFRYADKKKLSKIIMIGCAIVSLVSFIVVGVTAPPSKHGNEVVQEQTTENVTQSETETTAEAETIDEQNDVNNVEMNAVAQALSDNQDASKVSEFNSTSVPPYTGKAYAVVNDNVPYFSDSDLSTTSFETYGSLDKLGRCTTAYANVGQDIMPTEKRGAIGSVKPTGWHTIKYDCVDGKYLYNRCHLIGFQLTAENANKKNLITGTRYLNVTGMLPFENMVADYIKETNNHVLYRVTPIFEGDNLVASGVLMEAKSVENNGSGILFNVFCYNVQPGVIIDYALGDSSEGSPVYEAAEVPGNVSADTEPVNDNINASSNDVVQPLGAVSVDTPAPDTNGDMVWISKTGSKYHSNPNCSNMKNPSQITKEEAEARNLKPCSKCY